MALVLALVANGATIAQGVGSAPPVPGVVNVVDGAHAAELDSLVSAAQAADIVFLGEHHDDPVAHAIHLHVLSSLHESAASTRPVVLGMEAWERDVQLVLDEYLTGHIREQDLLAAARPWSNYEAAYEPLVAYAKQHSLPLVATNVPSRYANLVAREGLDALSRLPASSHRYLPAFPPAPPSHGLSEAFRDAMEGMDHAHGHALDVEALLAAQNLRDASMAEVVRDAYRAHPGAVVVHVNGVFHSQGRMGIPEHLARLAPDLRILTVSIVPLGTELPAGDDFVIYTEPPDSPRE